MVQRRQPDVRELVACFNDCGEMVTTGGWDSEHRMRDVCRVVVGALAECAALVFIRDQSA
jgi:hypothetical protein